MKKQEISIADLISKGFDAVYPETDTNFVEREVWNKKKRCYEKKLCKSWNYDLPSHCFGFFDWFGSDSSLHGKAKKMFSMLKGFALKTKKFDPMKTYVFFTECIDGGTCAMKCYCKVCDLDSGEVLYCISPNEGGQASIWGKDNGFEEALYEGKGIAGVRKWFTAA